jgi:hypothetical protein
LGTEDARKERDGKRGLDEAQLDALGLPKSSQKGLHLGREVLHSGKDCPVFHQPVEAASNLPVRSNGPERGEPDEQQGAEQQNPEHRARRKICGGVEEAEMMIGMADGEMKMKTMVFQDQDRWNEGGDEDHISQDGRKGERVKKEIAPELGRLGWPKPLEGKKPSEEQEGEEKVEQ